MSATAIVMMIVAMLILWGGLALAILHLNRTDGGDVSEIHRDL